MKKRRYNSVWLYETWTRAGVFSQTLANGNSKNKKKDKETEEGNKRGASIESSKTGTKKRSPDGLSLPNQITIIINIIR